MNTIFLSRMRNARTFLTRLWVLSRPYWYANDWATLRLGPWSMRVRERWIARATLLAITV